jgi:hypothetical protein
MKKLITILALLSVSTIFAQTPEGVVLIPNYPVDYQIQFDREVDVNTIRKVQQPIDYLRQVDYLRPSNRVFIRGNFNRVNVIQNIIEIPRATVDNNNYEYIKTTQFNPQRTLQEILRDE